MLQPRSPLRSLSPSVARATGALLLAAGCLGAQAVRAGADDLTVDEARALASPLVESDLASAAATTEVLGEDTFVTFVAESPAMRVRVNATQGVLASWVRLDTPYVVEGELPEDQAIGLAREVALRTLGAAAENLAWHASRAGDGYEIVGTGPEVGDPPRSGLTPSVRAHVLVDGTVLSYSQRMPSDDGKAPAPVTVSEDEACEIALSDLGLAGFEARGRLTQQGNEARWSVTVSDHASSGPRGHAPRSVLYAIDASTGAILERHMSSSSGWVERGRPSWAGGPSRGDLPAQRRAYFVAIAAMLLVTFTLAFVLWRRRR